MVLRISDIAALTGAVVTGNPEAEISRLAKIEEASAGDLTFLYHSSYEKYFAQTKATAVIVKTGFNKTRGDITYLECDAPEKAFFAVLITHFSPQFPLEGIAASASVHTGAVLGKNVRLGENVVIGSGCVIGDNTRIFHNSVLMENVTVGADCLFFPNVTVRENCVIGSRVILQPGAIIGADGFGYVPDQNKKQVKIPQIGNVVLEDDVEIGAGTCIDRAALGSTIIKRGTKLDNLVQIAHNVAVGEDTVISAQTGVSGSSKIGSNVIIAGQVGIAGHIEIGDNVIVLAQSGITKSLKKPAMYFGYPAKEHNHALTLEAHLRGLPDYVKRIKALEEKIKELEAKQG